MSSTKRIYQIYFGIDNKAQMAPEEGKNKNETAGSNVQIKEYFKFYDYNSSATIGYLKEYFLSTFGQKYKYCKC